MFIDNYLRICELHGKSPTTVLKELKISNSVYDNWKKGAEPLNPTKFKIANYFNITVDELNCGEIEKPATSEGDELDAEIMKYYNLLSTKNRTAALAVVKSLLATQE